MEFACYRHFRLLGGVLAIVFVVSGSAQEITVRGDGCARIPPSAPHDLKASPVIADIYIYFTTLHPI
jgi:hypothetical protein